VIREELSRLFTRGERHRRLFARLLLAFGLSTVVFAVGTVLIWVFESGQKGGNIHGLGDALFLFRAIADRFVEYDESADDGQQVCRCRPRGVAIFVVTAVARSFATFFRSGDASLSASVRLWSLPYSAWTRGRWSY